MMGSTSLVPRPSHPTSSN